LSAAFESTIGCEGVSRMTADYLIKIRYRTSQIGVLRNISILHWNHEKWQTKRWEYKL